MAITLNTNVEATNVLRNLTKTQRNLANNITKLSTGLRINKAADDAAGLAISEQMRGLIRSSGQAQRNALDGVSLIQVAEGGMNEIHNIVGRLRELAVQSANGIYDNTTRTYMNDEFKALISEIDRVANNTDFNGRVLLSAAGTYKFWVGVYGSSATNAISVSILDVNAAQLSGLNAATISTQAGSVTALATLDKAVKYVSSARGKLGAAQNRLQISVDNVASQRENLMAANSRIRDVDVASETSEFTRNQILMQAGVSVLAQANQLPSVGLSLLK